MTPDRMERYTRIALEEARLAGEAGDVPVGACIVIDHRGAGPGHRTGELTGDRYPVRSGGAAAAAQADRRMEPIKSRPLRHAGTLPHVRRCADSGPRRTDRIRRIRWPGRLLRHPV